MTPAQSLHQYLRELVADGIRSYADCNLAQRCNLAGLLMNVWQPSDAMEFISEGMRLDTPLIAAYLRGEPDAMEPMLFAMQLGAARYAGAIQWHSYFDKAIQDEREAARDCANDSKREERAA